MANELTSQIHSKDGALGLLGLGGLRSGVEDRTAREKKSEICSQQRETRENGSRKVTKERTIRRERKGCQKDTKIHKRHKKDTKGWVGQDLPNSLVKDALEIPLRQSRALDVLVDNLVRLVDILDVVQHVLVSDRLHVLLGKGSAGARVVSKINLGADQDNGGSGGVVSDLRKPLFKESDACFFFFLPQAGVIQREMSLVPLRQRCRTMAGSRRRSR